METSNASLKTDALTVNIPTAIRLTGLSRSALYLEIKRGNLLTRKYGRATLIEGPSINKLVDSMTRGCGPLPASLAKIKPRTN